MALEFSDTDGLGGGTAPDFAHRYLYGAAVDQVLAVEDAAGDVLWGLADHQGTIRDVVQHDGLDTVLVNHVEYDSFGNPTDGTAPIADFLFAFTGRPLDPDTGLYDYRARWYDPAVGRFLSEDPAGLSADANLHRYCGNSPVVNVDPSGLWGEWGDSVNYDIYSTWSMPLDTGFEASSDMQMYSASSFPLQFFSDLGWGASLSWGSSVTMSISQSPASTGWGELDTSGWGGADGGGGWSGWKDSLIDSMPVPTGLGFVNIPRQVPIVGEAFYRAKESYLEGQVDYATAVYAGGLATANQVGVEAQHVSQGDVLRAGTEHVAFALAQGAESRYGIPLLMHQYPVVNIATPKVSDMANKAAAWLSPESSARGTVARPFLEFATDTAYGLALAGPRISAAFKSGGLMQGLFTTFVEMYTPMGGGTPAKQGYRAFQQQADELMHQAYASRGLRACLKSS